MLPLHCSYSLRSTRVNIGITLSWFVLKHKHTGMYLVPRSTPACQRSACCRRYRSSVGRVPLPYSPSLLRCLFVMIVRAREKRLVVYSYVDSGPTTRTSYYTKAYTLVTIDVTTKVGQLCGRRLGRQRPLCS